MAPPRIRRVDVRAPLVSGSHGLELPADCEGWIPFQVEERKSGQSNDMASKGPVKTHNTKSAIDLTRKGALNMSEPWIPVPPPVEERDTSEPIPVCPICGGMLRRNTDEGISGRRCDLHGHVTPEWVELPEEENE